MQVLQIYNTDLACKNPFRFSLKRPTCKADLTETSIRLLRGGSSPASTVTGDVEAVTTHNATGIVSTLPKRVVGAGRW